MRRPVRHYPASKTPGWLAVVVLLALSGTTAGAQDKPASAPSSDLDASHHDIDNMAVPPAPSGEEWWRDLIKRFPECRALTDDCQSCANQNGTLTCSNPGIACQRKEWHCIDAAKSEPTTSEPQDKPSSK